MRNIILVVICVVIAFLGLLVSYAYQKKHQERKYVRPCTEGEIPVMMIKKNGKERAFCYGKKEK